MHRPERQRRQLNKAHRVTEAAYYSQIPERIGQNTSQGQRNGGSCLGQTHTQPLGGDHERDGDLWTEALSGVQGSTSGRFPMGL